MDEILNPKSAFDGIRSRQAPSSTVLSTDGTKPRQVSKSVLTQIQQLADKKKLQGAGPGTYQKLKQEEKRRKELMKRKARGGYDMWSDGPHTNNDSSVTENPYLEPAMPKLAKKPILPAVVSEIETAVEVTPAGASYRPTFEDHQNLLQEALDEELKKIAVKEAIDKKLSYPAELDALDEEALVEEEEDSEEEFIEEEVKPTDNEDVSSSKKDVKRKTKAERNKERKRVREEKELAKIQEQKKILKQISQ